MTRVPPHISASQIATSRQCLRRWWFEKVHGLTSPGTAATLFGSTLHAVVEGYLLKMNEQQLSDHIKSTVPDTTPANIKKAKELLAVAIPAAVLPRPGAGKVEEEMLIPFPPMAGGLKGRLDYVDLDRPVPFVLDHKTTSDPAYAKTEETLRSDPQVILYAYWALLQRPDASTVEVRYVYYLTRGGSRVWAVDISLTREQVESSFAWLSQEISKMVSTFGVEDAGSIDYKMAACNAYGRPCPAMGVCPAHSKPDAPGQTGISRLRALARASALTTTTTTTTSAAAYAAVPKESKTMPISAGQARIALTKFGKIFEAAGISADVRGTLQEDVLADTSIVSEPLPDVSAELKSLDPSTPSNPIGQITQWLLNEARARVEAAKKAQANLSSVTAAPPVFEDVVLSDEQLEIKEALLELNYPETEAIRIVTREFDLALDLVGNGIVYSGGSDDDAAGDEPVAAAEPPKKGSPLAGKANAPAVVSPAPSSSAAGSDAAFADAVSAVRGTGAAIKAMKAAYADLEGDDLTTVDAWLVGRSGQVGKTSLTAFLTAFANGIDTSTLGKVNKGEDGIREVYTAALRSIKDTARARNVGDQIPAIVLLFGGAMNEDGSYTLPFRSAPVVEEPAPKPAAAPKPVAPKPTAAPKPVAAPVVEEPAPTPAPAAAPGSSASAFRLDVYIDIALVRGALPGAVPLSDLWMDAITSATEATGKDPRLDQYGSALKPVALAVAREVASRAESGNLAIFVESGSASWKYCSDEIISMADTVLRGA
jgi:hypothetical protein